MFLFGGCTEDESKYFNDAFTLNTRTMTWACVRIQVRLACSYLQDSIAHIHTYFRVLFRCLVAVIPRIYQRSIMCYWDGYLEVLDINIICMAAANQVDIRQISDEGSERINLRAFHERKYLNDQTRQV